MAKFHIVTPEGTIAEGVTLEGVTAAQVDKLVKKGKARFDVSPVHAMVEPVGVEISSAAMAESMTRPAEAGIRLKAGELTAQQEAHLKRGAKENADALKAATKKDAAAKAEAVKEVLKGRSHPDLVKLAKKEKVTFSARGSKEEIAVEIVEARQAQR